MSATSIPKFTTLHAVVPEADLPEPGSSVSVELSNGMYAEIHNLRRGWKLERQPHSLRYVAVTTGTKWEEVIHAGINRRVNGRNRLERFTLCDRGGERLAKERVPGALEETVTCRQCRSHLQEDGMIDTLEPPGS